MCRTTYIFPVLLAIALAPGCRDATPPEAIPANQTVASPSGTARARMLLAAADTLNNDTLALELCREAITTLEPLLETGQDTAAKLLYYKSQRKAGSRLISLGRPERSAALFDSLFPSLKKELGAGHPELEHYLIDFSKAYYKGGHVTQQGIERYRQFLEEFQRPEAESPKLAGLCHQIIGTLFQQQYKYAESFPHLEKALSILQPLARTNNDSVVLSDVYNNLGVCYAVEGGLYAGIEYFQKALGLRRQALPDPHYSLASSYNNLAVAYGGLGEYHRSLEYYKQALDITRRLGQDYARGTAQLYVNIADGYFRMKDFDQALKYQRQAVAIDRHNADSIRLAFSLQGLATTLNSIGQYGQALAMLQEALAISRQYFGETHARTIGALGSIADVYSAMEDSRQALEYDQRAAAAFGPDTLDGDYAAVISDLGVEHFFLGNFSKALHYHERALKIKQQLFSPEHPELLLSMILAGQALAHQGQHEQADGYFREALSRLIPGAGRDRIAQQVTPALVSKVAGKYELINALQFKAENSFFAFREEPGAATLQEALEDFKRLDTVRNILKTDFNGQLSFSYLLRELQPAYAQAVQLALEGYASTGAGPGLLRECFYFMEKNKANLLSDYLQAAHAKRAAGIPETVLDEERNLASRLAYYEKEALETPKSGGAGRPSPYQDSVFHYKQMAEAFRQRLRRDYPRYYKMRYDVRVASIAEVQNRLPGRRAVLLAFALEEDYSAVIAIAKDTVLHHYNPKDSTTAQLVDSLRALLAAPPGPSRSEASIRREQAAANELSHLLYRRLLHPILRQLPEAAELIIIPDGKLGYLPFELLLTEPATPGKYRSTPYLLKKYSIRYEHAATLFLQEPPKDAFARKAFAGLAPDFPPAAEELALGHPDTGFFRTAFPEVQGSPAPLRHNTAEVKAISRQLGGASFTGRQASKSLFLEKAAGYRIIHLATHAFVNDDFPEYAHFLLAAGDTTETDPRLYAYEIYNMRLNAELAVLSACETGAGKLQRGEGIMSLARAFQYAGCPNIVTSLWKADDRSTKDIMLGFYRHLKAGMGKAEALRQAKLDFLATAGQRYTHPFYWGTFILIGDNAPVELGGSNAPAWLWGLGLLLAAGLFLWWKKRKAATRIPSPT
ncbi:MAG: CHAT domain-containing protein [Phaeodactylibacter sp.]|nr:CHAT domain-containing protein [Phaeodactylibacter sp.]